MGLVVKLRSSSRNHMALGLSSKPGTSVKWLLSSSRSIHVYKWDWVDRSPVTVSLVITRTHHQAFQHFQWSPTYRRFADQASKLRANQCIDALLLITTTCELSFLSFPHQSLAKGIQTGCIFLYIYIHNNCGVDKVFDH